MKYILILLCISLPGLFSCAHSPSISEENTRPVPTNLDLFDATLRIKLAQNEFNIPDSQANLSITVHPNVEHPGNNFIKQILTQELLARSPLTKVMVSEPDGHGLILNYEVNEIKVAYTPRSRRWWVRTETLTRRAYVSLNYTLIKHNEFVVLTRMVHASAEDIIQLTDIPLITGVGLWFVTCLVIVYGKGYV